MMMMMTPTCPHPIARWPLPLLAPVIDRTGASTHADVPPTFRSWIDRGASSIDPPLSGPRSPFFGGLDARCGRCLLRSSLDACHFFLCLGAPINAPAPTAIIATHSATDRKQMMPPRRWLLRARPNRDRPTHPSPNRVQVSIAVAAQSLGGVSTPHPNSHQTQDPLTQKKEGWAAGARPRSVARARPVSRRRRRSRRCVTRMCVMLGWDGGSRRRAKARCVLPACCVDPPAGALTNPSIAAVDGGRPCLGAINYLFKSNISIASGRHARHIGQDRGGGRAGRAVAHRAGGAAARDGRDRGGGKTPCWCGWLGAMGRSIRAPVVGRCT